MSATISQNRSLPVSVAGFVLIAALFATMSQPLSPALACMTPISLSAMNVRLAKPDLAGELLTQARKLRVTAAAEIENGHLDEGRRLYYQLMTLLGIVSNLIGAPQVLTLAEAPDVKWRTTVDEDGHYSFAVAL